MNIVVIGGKRGVGFEIVKNCLLKGYQVALACKEEDVSFSSEFSGKVLIRSFNLKKIEGVVFYAGITPISSLTDCSEDLYDEIFNINLKSTFFIAQRVIKNMMEHDGGSFVFFGSSHMESGQIDRAAYAISKGSIKILSEHLAKRYSKFQIRSNIIVMGWTPTEGELELRASLGISKEELIAEASNYVPMGRMLNVNDPVPAVMYFLSNESCMVTGSTIRVNGGEYI